MLNKIKTAPKKPGVYIFRDSHDRVLYVGKARELRSRIGSYFQKASAVDMRKAAMLRSVSDFGYTVTGNELEALVLEANLIKQYRPRFNILLRDDKNYPYIKLDIKEQWPRLQVVRRIQKDGACYFGPYVPAGAMWNTLSFIRDNFQIRTCKYSLEKRMRPCIQHQIKKCMAPCAGLVTRRAYMEIMHQVKLLLEGRNKGLLNILAKKMSKLSEQMRYEEAAVLRDRIKALRLISETQKAVAPGLGDVDVIGFCRTKTASTFKILFSRNGIMIGSRDFHLRNVHGEDDGYLIKSFIQQFYAGQIMPAPLLLCQVIPEDSEVLKAWLSDRRGSGVDILVPKRGIKKNLVAMAVENARILCRSRESRMENGLMKELAGYLNLRSVPEDIGAFDISNISGKEAVGSFVYWSDGTFRKDRYRHIRIDTVKGPDDYSMMREMIGRTIENLGYSLPGLVIIDGGKGHLDAAMRVFHERGITGSYVISIAKSPDRVFQPGRKNPLVLEDDKAHALLLRKIRDEAHRFAFSYHKKLRSRRIFESPLEKIPGVGRKRRFELLRHFGSIEAVKNASAEEITALKGFNRKTAEKIMASLKGRQNG